MRVAHPAFETQVSDGYARFAAGQRRDELQQGVARQRSAEPHPLFAGHLRAETRTGRAREVAA